MIILQWPIKNYPRWCRRTSKTRCLEMDGWVWDSMGRWGLSRNGRLTVTWLSPNVYQFMAISMEHYEHLTTDHWMDLVNVLNFGEHLCFLSVEGWFTLADFGIKKKTAEGNLCRKAMERVKCQGCSIIYSHSPHHNFWIPSRSCRFGLGSYWIYSFWGPIWGVFHMGMGLDFTQLSPCRARGSRSRTVGEEWIGWLDHDLRIP